VARRDPQICKTIRPTYRKAAIFYHTAHERSHENALFVECVPPPLLGVDDRKNGAEVTNGDPRETDGANWGSLPKAAGIGRQFEGSPGKGGTRAQPGSTWFRQKNHDASTSVASWRSVSSEAVTEPMTLLPMACPTSTGRAETFSRRWVHDHFACVLVVVVGGGQHQNIHDRLELGRGLIVALHNLRPLPHPPGKKAPVNRPLRGLYVR
jgi:hypothetical protein